MTQARFEQVPALRTDTEGIKYAGSKKALIPQILRLVAPLGVQTVFDGFAGTTRVAQAFSRNNYRVICNDRAIWSRVFGECYLLNQQPPAYYQPMIDYLNQLRPEDGWFSAHYGGHANGGVSVQSDGKKRIWQLHNTRKLDAIRPAIDAISADPIERSVLLTSLILALDEVENTVGHYVSYLREWSPRSYKALQLKVPRLLPNHEQNCVLCADIFDVVDTVACDLAYYDPPYGSCNEKMPPSRVRYASYYHIWTTICLNDRPPLVGAANRRADAGDVYAASAFEDFRRDANGRYTVVNTIAQLLARTNARYILLSYGSAGRMTRAELLEMIRDLGRRVEFAAIDHKRNVMASMKWTDAWAADPAQAHQEYLLLLEG